MKWNENLKNERQSRGWTQSMLAEKIGTNRYTINRWENGVVFPSLFYREKLKAIFGTNFEEREDLQNVSETDHCTSEQSHPSCDKEFMRRLKNERQSRRWTQSMLAEKIGINKQTVIRWENGTVSPQPFYREKLTALFGVNFEERNFLQALPKTDHYAPERSPYLFDSEDIHHEHNPSQPLVTPSPQLVPSLVQDDQVDQQEKLWTANYLLLPDALLQMRSSPLSRPSKHFSWHSLLIVSTISLSVGILITVLLAFMLLPFFRSLLVPKSSTSPSSPTVLLETVYEAEAPENQLANGAKTYHCYGCSRGVKVRYIGQGGTLQLNNIRKSHAGNYRLTLYYVDGDASKNGTMTRTVYMSVNAGPAIALKVSGNGNWNMARELSVMVHLHAGNNSIKFFNPSAPGPDMDRIVV